MVAAAARPAIRALSATTYINDNGPFKKQEPETANPALKSQAPKPNRNRSSDHLSLFELKPRVISLGLPTQVYTSVTSKVLAASPVEANVYDFLTPIVPGMYAGFWKRVSTHPLENTATVMQFNDKITTMRAAISKMWHQEGAPGFVRGIVAGIAADVLKIGFQFSIADDIKKRMITPDANAPELLLGAFAAGSAAGLGTAVFTTIPDIQVIRASASQTFVMQGKPPLKPISLGQIASLGYPRIHHLAPYHISYNLGCFMFVIPANEIKNAYLSPETKEKYGVLINLGIGGVGGMFAVVSSQGLNTIFKAAGLSLIEKDPEKFKPFMQQFKQRFIQPGGLKNWLKGAGPRVIKVAPGVAVAWAAKEQAKAWFES